MNRPVVSAAIAGAWSLGAASFAIGYSEGDPDKRYSGGLRVGFLLRLATLGGFLGTCYTLYELIGK